MIFFKRFSRESKKNPTLQQCLTIIKRHLPGFAGQNYARNNNHRSICISILIADHDVFYLAIDVSDLESRHPSENILLIDSSVITEELVLKAIEIFERRCDEFKIHI